MSQRSEAEAKLAEFSGFQGLKPIISLFKKNRGDILMPIPLGVLASVDRAKVGLLDESRKDVSMLLRQAGTQEVLDLSFVNLAPEKVITLRSQFTSYDLVNLVNFRLGWFIQRSFEAITPVGIKLDFNSSVVIGAPSTDLESDQIRWVNQVIAEYERLQRLEFPGGFVPAQRIITLNRAEEDSN